MARFIPRTDVYVAVQGTALAFVDRHRMAQGQHFFRLSHTTNKFVLLVQNKDAAHQQRQ